MSREDLMDVCIRVYTTSADKEFCVVSFRNESEEFLKKYKGTKIGVEIKDDKIYFISNNEKGYRLKSDRFQIWRNANEIKDWAGCYPLNYDLEKNQYYIGKINQRSFDSAELPARKGMHYNTHVSAKVEAETSIDFDEMETKLEKKVEENIHNEVSIKYFKKSKNIAIEFLKGSDKLIHSKKVDLQIEGDRMYFLHMNEDVKNEGFRIWPDSHKISINRSVINKYYKDSLNDFIGISELKCDIHKGWYITKKDVRPFEESCEDEISSLDIVSFLEKKALAALAKDEIENARIFAKAIEIVKKGDN